MADPVAANGGPHSAAFLGQVRSFWWNHDYLKLLGRRLDLPNVLTMLDVGCGVGHWGQLLTGLLAPTATVVGVDREPQWIDRAMERARNSGLAERFTYLTADAEHLPYPDGSFDLVTCQTLLIHVPDPQCVLREMWRVTAPGGLVVLAEPSNNAATLIGASDLQGITTSDQLERVKFMLICADGKKALGEGDVSVGDLVPGYVAELRPSELLVFQNDKARFMVPPYLDERQQAMVAGHFEDVDAGRHVWSRDEARRFFEAGGGELDQFDAIWRRRLVEDQRRAEAVRRGEFHMAGGQVFYLVAGRKPLTGKGA